MVIVVVQGLGWSSREAAGQRAAAGWRGWAGRRVGIISPDLSQKRNTNLGHFLGSVVVQDGLGLGVWLRIRYRVRGMAQD